MTGRTSPSPSPEHRKEPIEVQTPQGDAPATRPLRDASRVELAVRPRPQPRPMRPRPAATRPAARATAPPRKRREGFNVGRFLLESITVLALAVTIFRAFVLEGFMITSGSMAPALFGFHHRVTCPDCSFQFTINASHLMDQAERSDGAAAHVAADSHAWQPPREESGQKAPGTAISGFSCPNCKYAHIQTTTGLVNEGDQLLVDKQGTFWSDPQRWDAIVFRNPHRSTQAYAKRVVGLPGEIIALKDGDVYVRGAIQRKSLEQQRQLRVLVADSRYQPKLKDENWRNNWQPEEAKAGAWLPLNTGFRFEPPPQAAAGEQFWLQYAHWVREGGTRKSSVPLERWPTDIPLPPAAAPVKFDPIRQQLTCLQALPADLAGKLHSLSRDEAFQTAIQQLFELSHQQPITDRLVYNQEIELGEKPVRDLMLELDLLPDAPQCQLSIRLHDGYFPFVASLDFSSQRAELRVAGNDKVLRSGSLPEWRFEQPIKVEMSVFDQQVLLAINNVLVFEPYAYRVDETPFQLARTPIAVAASGAPLTLLRQRVYRDLYYRPGPSSDGQEQEREYHLGPDEYFVLGDNSLVSIDSRHWPAGSVTRSLLIGRPVVLHLPSRRTELSLGPYETRVRIPDWNRMRVLR